MVLGDFELRLGRKDKAKKSFETALRLARNPAERRFLERRVRSCHL